MKRHIGKIANTDQRCVVVFMQIPGRTDHALVVSTDNLPPMMEQAVIEIVDSAEGQGDAVLANVLGRRLFADSGKNVLQVLHEMQLLRPVSIDNVLMTPRPNMHFPLRKIVENMGSPPPIATSTEPSPAEQKFNQHAANSQIQNAEDRSAIARNLLIEADMLQADADAKRRRAFDIAPEMAPKIEVPVVALETVVPVARTARKKPAAPKKKVQ